MKKKIISVLFLTLLFCICVITSSIKTQAVAPPDKIEKSDGGHHIGGTFVTFSYQLIRTSYDPIAERAEYKLGQYFSISGSPIPIMSDYVYITNSLYNNTYLGFYDKHNGTRPAGVYTRDKWLYPTLVPGRNVITIRGDSSGVAGTGDAQFIVDIDRFGHDPVVHGIDGIWTSGDVSSGLRTWQSLWTDGATGSAEGNKTATSTGFFFSDEDEQKERVPAYTDVFISKNGSITEIKKQNTDGSWSPITIANWSEMDNPGLYWVKACTKDQANNQACGTRYITVNQKQYEVKYNGNGSTSGTMSNSTHKYDEPKALSENQFTKTGYQFSNWNTKADGTGIPYTDEQSVTNLTDINGAVVNLYARWTPNTYTIKYNGNGATSGSVSNSTHTYDTAKNLNENKYVRTGHTFIGWNTKADGSGITYTNRKSVKNLTTENDATINLYAIWDKAPTINATDRTYYDSEHTQKEWIDQLRLQDVTANDDEDGNLTSKIVVTSDNIDMDNPGIYQVNYQVTDSVGNITNKPINVTIKHNYPPVITATDKSFYSDEYTKDEWKNTIRMQDVTSVDVEDGNLTSKIQIVEDFVDPTIPGSYKVTYKVTDSHNKTTIKTINVEVMYNHAPVINASSFKFYENEYSDDEWKEEFMKQVTSDDAEDGDLTNNVTIKSTNVNPIVPGAYEVVLTVTDSRGKTTEKTVDVTVLENRQPHIQIYAESKRFIEGEYTIDEWYNERMQKVTAYDAEDNDLTDEIQIKSDSTIIDKPGKYKVTYTVTDQYGKTAEKDALVTVIPNNPPEIFASDKWFTTSDKIMDEDLLKNVLSIDDHDGDISDKVKIKQSDVKVGKAGNYDVTYTVSDRFGKTTDKTVIIHITESSGIPIKPNPPITFDPDALGIWNNQSKGLINVTKLMETSVFENDPGIYNKVTFGVYSAEDITYKGTVILQKDSLVAIAKPNMFGQLYATVHHKGRYYLKELETHENYVLSNQKYYFVFE